MTRQGETTSSSLTNLLRPDGSSRPLGISLFGSYYQFRSTHNKRLFHKILVVALTFLAYAGFHMGRRPLSIVKNVLNHGASENTPQSDDHTNTNLIDFSVAENSGNDASRRGNWAPFDDDTTANRLLGLLDTAFLLSYAICMFFSGMIAERMNLRYFISIGSILSGLGLIAFGLAYKLEIHSFSYFVIIQLLSGATQSIGWPVVVTCVSNWFEPMKRGLIYGLWNSHTSIGNILGATISGYFVEDDWGLSFIVPGALMILIGAILYLFLAPNPRDVGLVGRSDDEEDVADFRASISNVKSRQFKGDRSRSHSGDAGGGDRNSNLNRATEGNEPSGAVSFCMALKIPGVIEYSLCLFFSKLVCYTFLYWLPRYIKASTGSDSEDSAYLSTPFDVGGIVGAILAGYLSDVLGVNGLICNVMLILAIPGMYLYESYGALSDLNNIGLQLIVGLLVNGPYCLITTSVSAELGDRIKDSRAIATVSAIIDGMGSLGAVVGPLFAGIASRDGNWQPVFIMLMLSDVFASICLTRVSVHEIRKWLANRKKKRTHHPSGDDA